MRESNLKFTNKLKNLGPKLRWFLFTELQDLRLTSDYIDMICPNKKESGNSISKLENIVKQSLIREFSPEIQNSKSFDLLVNAVMNKIQKKSLGIDGKAE